jgi:glucose-1-phosphate adenylyltransferase
MDYAVMLAQHIQNGADLTVACVEVPRGKASEFGIVTVDAGDRIVNFVEKPDEPSGMPDSPDMALASMGVYIFNAKFLYEQLRRDAADLKSSHDFGKDIIPYLLSRAKVMAHNFSDSCVRPHLDAPVYWRDVGTIDSYWEANLDLTSGSPQLDLYDPDWPIFSYQEQLPPAKFAHDHGWRGGMVESLVSGGCIISGATVQRSLLFNHVRVNPGCRIGDAVLLPEVIVGRHARLNKVVVERGCRIPEGLVVGENPEDDARRFHRTDKGVVLINSEMIAAL